MDEIPSETEMIAFILRELYKNPPKEAQEQDAESDS